MKTKEVVKQLLIDKPHLRDSDNKLIATYWFNELKEKNIKLYNEAKKYTDKLEADGYWTEEEKQMWGMKWKY